MSALVVYESMFGNTQTIARAIAEGLATHTRVELVEVSRAATTIDAGVELLVAGGPTHAFGMTRPRTRDDAAKQAERPLVSPGIGLREWLAALRPGNGVPAATFDTRIDKPRWMTGSAARGFDRALRKLGFRPVAPPESFLVAGTPGPLVDGEAERARQWGSKLGARFAGIGPGRRVS
jgi:Flavodoxin